MQRIFNNGANHGEGSQGFGPETLALRFLLARVRRLPVALDCRHCIALACYTGLT